VNDFADCINAGVPFLVATADDDVAGYAVAHYGGDEGEILNLGVGAAHRRRGMGRALIEEMLRTLGRRGVRSAYLEVRESNNAAQRLYEALGFTKVGRRTRYYRRPVEDAVILRAAIPAVRVSAKL
jgi:[ribosomal protein S18]-alanine N-acetyltransferase